MTDQRAEQIVAESVAVTLGGIVGPAKQAQVVEQITEDLCARGFHAWVPWLRLDNGSFVTWCVRCKHSEGFDV